MKKFLCSLLVGIMLMSSLSVSAASFTDVDNNTWYYETVSVMSEMGLFKGKGENMFCPNDTMTRAEFITVVSRILYPDMKLSDTPDSAWWMNDYIKLTDNKVIDYDIFELNLDTKMSREEMAYVAVKALVARGEDISKLNGNIIIPDSKSISDFYVEYVVIAYGKGIIAGDEKGNFNPQNTLTRAEASTVLYRLIETSARVIPDKKPVPEQTDKIINKDWHDSVIQNTGAITIKEYEKSVRRLAQEGDTVVKANGEKVVLKKGPNGILGEGQGVAPDAGMQQVYNGGTVTVIPGGTATNIFGYTESTGKSIKNQAYEINKITGEGHWVSEWMIIEQAYPAPTELGEFDGQLSKDGYWLYNEYSGNWVFASYNQVSDSAIPHLREINGLN